MSSRGWGRARPPATAPLISRDPAGTFGPSPPPPSSDRIVCALSCPTPTDRPTDLVTDTKSAESAALGYSPTLTTVSDHDNNYTFRINYYNVIANVVILLNFFSLQFLFIFLSLPAAVHALFRPENRWLFSSLHYIIIDIHGHRRRRHQLRLPHWHQRSSVCVRRATARRDYP